MTLAQRPHWGWGPWVLNSDNATLCLVLPPWAYCIDLENRTGPAQVLDWVAQVANKTWGDDATVAGLVRALDGVLGLQPHLCSSGQPGRLTVAQVHQRAPRDLAKGYRQHHWAVTCLRPGPGEEEPANAAKH